MSVNRELNQLRERLDAERKRATDAERKLQALERRHRLALGLLRDQHRSTEAIAKFIATEGA